MTMWGLWCYCLFSVMGVASLINWFSYWCVMAITQYPSQKPHQNHRNFFNFRHNYSRFSSKTKKVFIVDLMYTSLVMNVYFLYKIDPIRNHTKAFWLNFFGVFHMSWRIFVLCYWNVILWPTLIMYYKFSCLDTDKIKYFMIHLSIGPYSTINYQRISALDKMVGTFQCILSMKIG